jgi:hypothetical protein
LLARLRWSAMSDERDAEAVLLTGVFGCGKSSVAAEIADLLEKAGLPYAALDLDWLAWFDSASDDRPTEHRMMLTNLAPIVGNYLAVGVRFFVLARSIRDRLELDGLKAVVPMPLTVVRLTVPLPEIQSRLRSDVTTGRRDDLREAADWVAKSLGVGIEDLMIANERPIREVAADVLDRLGWVR